MFRNWHSMVVSGACAGLFVRRTIDVFNINKLLYDYDKEDFHAPGSSADELKCDGAE